MKAIGCFTNKDKIRVSFHPDHFTVLNSPKEEILHSSLKELQHHCLLLKEMGLDKGTKLVTHVGGTYNDRGKIDQKKLSYDLTDTLDVMLEAKQKDKAMLKLVEDLAGYPFI